MRSRRLPVLLVTAACLALSACAGTAAPRSATLVGTAPIGTPSTVAAAGATPTAVTTTTPAAATTVPASTAATDPGTTAPAAATSAPDATGAPTTARPATASTAPPAATTAPSAVTAARVAAMYTRIGYPVTDPEAACLAGMTDASVVAAIEAEGDAAIAGKVAGSLVQALARCEPKSFLEEQDEITMADYRVDSTQARCVTKALDAAASADPVIALAYFEGTTTLPPDLQQQLIAKLTPCVGEAKAREIVTT